jgi:hypothetical protein
VVVGRRRLEAPVDHLAQPVGSARVRNVPALLGQAGEDVVDVADELDLGDEVLVDLRGFGVDHDDRLVAPGVPVLRRVLDQVEADRQDDVSLLEAGHLVVVRLKADGAERLRVARVEQPLGHERLGDGDTGRADELAQRGRRAPAHHAVAADGHRVQGAADQVRGLQQLARRRLGANRLAARQRL